MQRAFSHGRMRKREVEASPGTRRGPCRGGHTEQGVWTALVLRCLSSMFMDSFLVTAFWCLRYHHGGQT